MLKFLSGLLAGFAITHIGYGLFAPAGDIEFFGRTWSPSTVWIEVVVYAALSVVVAYFGWRTKAPR